MKTYNIYYLREGIQYDLKHLSRIMVLDVVGNLLSQDCEITGIIDSEKDN